MKKLFILLLIISVLCLTSCSHLEDVNGADDYSIATITDEQIISGMNNISVGSIHGSKTINGKTTGTYKVNKFSGVLEIEEFTSKNTLILITISNECTSGNFLVVITSGDEIVLKVLANESQTVELPNNGMRYQLKIVGESAKFSLEYSFS